MPEPKSADSSSAKNKHFQRARWFGAEFLVVAAGVLAALAGTSWWEGLSDRNRETAYLDQLAVDLEVTYQRIDEADSTMRQGDIATARIVQSYRTPEFPSADSLHRWIPAAYDWEGKSAQLVVSTAEALLATGDLRLIESGPLRSAVVAYLEAADEAKARNQSGFDYYRVGVLNTFGQVDFVESVLATVADGQVWEVEVPDAMMLFPPPPHRNPFPLSVPELMADRDAYSGLLTMLVMRLNERESRALMRESADQLRLELEHYLDGR